MKIKLTPATEELFIKFNEKVVRCQNRIDHQIRYFWGHSHLQIGVTGFKCAESEVDLVVQNIKLFNEYADKVGTERISGIFGLTACRLETKRGTYKDLYEAYRTIEEDIIATDKKLTKMINDWDNFKRESISGLGALSDRREFITDKEYDERADRT